IVLFAYVTGTTGTVRSSKSQQNELITTQTTDINVPVNVNMNENKYYVSGVPQTIKVKITGPSGLITSAQNSQTIRATINLEKPKIGSQNVSLKLTGLSDTLAKTLDPSSLTVNVSRKISKSVPIVATYNRDNIASKYVVSGFKISQTKATVTGPSDLVKVVNHISTSLNVPANTQASISKNIALKAVDKN
ncbi:CdaR family protein, partial [Liquorilactobacillus sicerae]|uniref:CdaR family protein n=1 Tax=Liquorilactobacillus sicerae TaxID=1416943 RepID=UPI0024814E77